MSLEEDLQNLWVRAVLKHRKLRISASQAAQTKAGIQKHYLKPFFANGGSISLKRNQKEVLEAAVMSFSKKDQRAQQLIVLSMPGDKASLKWAESKIDSMLSHYRGKCFIQLQPWQSGLLKILSKHGVGLRAVKLEGHVSRSLKHLRAHYGADLRTPFEKAGLTLAPAKNKKEIEQYLKILRSEYKKNPQFGSIVASAQFLDFIRKDILHAMKNKKQPLWLVQQRDRIVGGVDIIETGPALDGRKRASFGVNLIEAYQGQNLARAIYETVLIELAARGIETYIGNTAQPGVMRLGQIVGRKLQGIEADRGIAPHFPRGHFKPWL